MVPARAACACCSERSSICRPSISFGAETSISRFGISERSPSWGSAQDGVRLTHRVSSRAMMACLDGIVSGKAPSAVRIVCRCRLGCRQAADRLIERWRSKYDAELSRHMPGLGRQAERQVVLCNGGARRRKRYLSLVDRPCFIGYNERIGDQYRFTARSGQNDNAHLRAINRRRREADIWQKGNGNPKRLPGTQRHENPLRQAFAAEMMARQDTPV